ncbi:MAG: D-lyxose/D-mannose family sugar isomerase [Kiritimatiellae bacterium]|jgi:D-lyxose ketol-isomerase|nr:D-lyxose/D-mannose family sugar isomerase [Kiritimatiellia bacterium]
MINKKQYQEAKAKTLEYFDKLNISVTEQEKERIEIADFGLSDLYNVGLQILTYINTEKVCAKELVLFPYQTCPEHMHIDSGKIEGKEETFRCRYGTVYLYLDGEPTENIKARRFWKSEDEVSVFHEIELKAGEQYTLYPNTKHWFQAGEEGAVVSEFSTTSTDQTDVFTDKRIQRLPEVAE